MRAPRHDSPLSAAIQGPERTFEAKGRRLIGPAPPWLRCLFCDKTCCVA